MFVHFIALETLVGSNVEIIEVAVWKFHLSAITTLITSVLVKTTKYNPLRLLFCYGTFLFLLLDAFCKFRRETEIAK